MISNRSSRANAAHETKRDRFAHMSCRIISDSETAPAVAERRKADRMAFYRELFTAAKAAI